MLNLFSWTPRQLALVLFLAEESAGENVLKDLLEKLFCSVLLCALVHLRTGKEVCKAYVQQTKYS